MRTGHDQGPHAAMDMSAVQYGGGYTKVFNP